MRVTNMYMVTLAQAANAKNQSNVAQLTQEVSSGLRVSKPSDDPTAWLEAQRQKVQTTLNTGVGEAIQSATTRLQLTDGALATLSSVVSQAQELAVEGSSAQLTPSARADQAQQVAGLLQSALAAANTKDSDGNYVLSGTAISTQPFENPSGNYQGNGTALSVNTDATTTQQASLPGTALEGGVNIFVTLNTLVTALSSNNLTGIQSALGDLNTANTQLATTRAQVGGMMTTMQSAQTASTTLASTLQTSVASLTQVDAVQAASQLAQASTALQVSQAVTTKVLSLLEPSSS